MADAAGTEKKGAAATSALVPEGETDKLAGAFEG